MNKSSNIKKTFPKCKDPKILLNSPVKGRLETIEKSTNPTFSQKLLGDGIVVFPKDSRVYAPVDGKVSSVYPTTHALTMTVDKGIRILIQLGTDKLDCGLKCFSSHIEKNDLVKKGDLLLTIDMDLLEKKGYAPEVILVITEIREGVCVSIDTGEKTKDDPAICLSNI